MEKVYLAPCPFCAGLAKTDEYDPYDGYQGNNTVYRVKCRACGTEVTADSYDKAVRKWNSRAANLYTAKLQMGSPYGSALCKVPAMTAKAYVSITHRMLIEDDRAWDNLVVYESNGDCEKAVTFAEKWAQEHPEKKRKTYAEDFLEKMPNARRKDGVPLTCRGKAYGKPQLCKAMMDDDCLSCWNAEMEDEK